ncbi:hypothetical protein GY45DRAFT_333197 [Cubamyces sp. BRFM 1775]|nr:hypothetical protein GY45DRAFT_333197 [Cubamyces sp. BRFM 1775]
MWRAPATSLLRPRWSLHYFSDIIIPSTLSSYSPRISSHGDISGLRFFWALHSASLLLGNPRHWQHRSGHPRAFPPFRHRYPHIAGSAVGAGIHTPSSVARGRSFMVMNDVGRPFRSFRVYSISPLDPAQLLGLICANTTSSACSRIFPASHLPSPSSATLLYPVRSPIHRRIPPELYNRRYRRARKPKHIKTAAKLGYMVGWRAVRVFISPPGSHQWDDLQWVRPGASISSLLGWHRSPCALGFLGHSYWSCLFFHFLGIVL